MISSKNQGHRVPLEKSEARLEVLYASVTTVERKYVYIKFFYTYIALGKLHIHRVSTAAHEDI